MSALVLEPEVISCLVNRLADSGYMTKAAILSDDGKVCASSPGFEVREDEFKVISDASERYFRDLRKQFIFGKIPYTTINCNDTGCVGLSGKAGVTIRKCRKWWIVSYFDENVQYRNIEACNECVEGVAGILDGN
eukprot:CAMPEP_0184336176 /NCGR_PEP_ID=MMETSP1089-20130417/4570_1 /TAXON_ID=38269 ORGANISM="Gloeochaete wittrockiana, Strain SAG46.84" /NCGR_SAMPLE_ID=MMETSP1089 /ASSEMBLY_ACC=CAM_ASM_000445 /LENGTH=134 /DNA_ID=CAMNT_0026661131 /DNA_START=143 /DNA_END=544 /DNA_ORIENTATION=-